jgi:hypothetical protein
MQAYYEQNKSVTKKQRKANRKANDEADKKVKAHNNN